MKNRFSNLNLTQFGFDEELITSIERTLASCESDDDSPKKVVFTIPEDIPLIDTVSVGDALSIIADAEGWERGPVIRSPGMRQRAFVLPSV